MMKVSKNKVVKVNDSKIHQEYSKAIAKGSETVVSNTGKAKFADYSEVQLSHLPDNITEHSFGCGNPLAFANVKAGQTVLDLGCGAGLDLLLAAEKVGNTGCVIGVDNNRDMLNLAQKRISDYPHIKLKQGDIEVLPIESNSIDWVISNCVINLSDDKQSIFKEIARVLKPNGKILVSDIVAEHLPWWVRRSGILKAACTGGVISEKDYIDGLNKVGLKGVEVLARNHYEASELAAIVSDAAPLFLKKITCCGTSILHSCLKTLAKPIAKNLWSAKISASLSSSIN